MKTTRLPARDLPIPAKITKTQTISTKIMICPAKPSGEALVSNWQNWRIGQVEDICQI